MHYDFREKADCIWPHAEWIDGNGPYAVLAHCRVLTIQMYRWEDEAVAAKARIDRSACGGMCVRHHELVKLWIGATTYDLQRWAETRGVKESHRRWSDCLHGLVGRGAPSRSMNCGCPRGDSELLDHARLWNRGGRPAFLLAHVYGDVSPWSEGWVRAQEYADAFGVRVVVGDPADDWYGFGTTPLRYELRLPLSPMTRDVMLRLADLLDPPVAPAAQGSRP